jgi:hypothetical protein
VLQEVQAFSDNVTLFRMGTAPAVLAGIGATSGAPAGITVTFDADRMIVLTSGPKYRILGATSLRI